MESEDTHGTERVQRLGKTGLTWLMHLHLSSESKRLTQEVAALVATASSNRKAREGAGNLGQGDDLQLHVFAT